MKWSCKDFSMSVKDVDSKKGVVTAYANVYGNIDYDRDISAPNSFTKTVQENFKKIRVLKDHIWNVKLGVPLEIDTADPYGLLTRTQFNLEKEVSRDMYTDILLEMENGQQSDLSFGYDVVKSERMPDGVRLIKEYRMHEYSFLTFLGANPLSIVQDAKSLNSLTDTELIEHIKKATQMYNAKYSDGKLRQIESALKALEAVEPVITTQNARAAELKAWHERQQIQNYLNS